MQKPVTRAHSVLLVLISLACAASMWLYIQRVLIPYQKADAAWHNRPRGNLSDLYPRWLGTRELLLHGRDPYSIEVTREIQAGYYGRPLDSTRPDDPRDEERFAYPVYVVFLLAPAILFPFETAQRAFDAVMLLVTITSVPLWLRLIRWRVRSWALACLVLLTLGSPAVMQAFKLHQLTLLVAALLITATYLITRGSLVAAGPLLALATIKPHLAGLLLVWLTIWISADWRYRRQLAWSFLASMALLLGGSELLLPHWLPKFIQAVRAYEHYTEAGSVVDRMISPWLGIPVTILTVAMGLLICWQQRRHNADSEAFMQVLSLVLAVTVLIAPILAPYNQIILLPAILLLARERHAIRASGWVGAFLLALLVIAVGWPWFASIPIAAASFVLPAHVTQRCWTVPFWSAWLVPVATAASMLVIAYRGSRDTPPA